MKKTMLILLGGLWLAACSPDSDKLPTIAEGPLKAREKAIGVQETLNQGAERQQQQIDEQTQQ